MKKFKFVVMTLLTTLMLSSCGTTQQVPLTGRTHRISVSDEQVLSLSNQEYTKYIGFCQEVHQCRQYGDGATSGTEASLGSGDLPFKENGFAADVKNYSWEFNLVQDREHQCLLYAWRQDRGL